jgi:hypothetical protein
VQEFDFILAEAPPTNPVISTPSAGDGQLTVTVTSDQGGVRVYKSTVSGGPWTLAATVPILTAGNVYTFLVPGLTNDVAYYLIARHTSEETGLDEDSSEVSGTPTATGEPPPTGTDPIIRTVTVGDGTLSFLIEAEFPLTLELFVSLTAGSGHSFMASVDGGEDSEGNRILNLVGLTNGTAYYVYAREDTTGSGDYRSSDEVQGVPFDPNEVMPATRIRRAKILRII